MCQWSKKKRRLHYTEVITHWLALCRCSVDRSQPDSPVARAGSSEEAELWAARPPGKILITHSAGVPLPRMQQRKQSLLPLDGALSVLTLAEVQRQECGSLSTCYIFIRMHTRSQLTQHEDKCGDEMTSWRDCAFSFCLQINMSASYRIFFLPLTPSSHVIVAYLWWI